MIGYILSFLLLAVGLLFDKKISEFFYATQTSWFVSTLKIFSYLGDGIAVFLIVTMMLSALYIKKNKKNIFLFWASFAISMILVYLLKNLFLRQRPFYFGGESYKINHSFPSGHTNSVFCALPFFSKLRRLNYFWYVFSILVAFSRVYLGYHYLTDVVIGGLIGYTISMIIIKNFSMKESLTKKSKIKREK